ncbi:CsbD family protein [Streptomyces sp. NBC_01007]|nr:CsbD family protein [Streptomyces sp. NBC_01007]
MAGNEKARARTEQAKGKAGETAGHAVGKGRTTAEGRAGQAVGAARQAKEKVKDGFRH